MTKVAYNSCYGGFSLSYEGVMHYAKIKGIKVYAFVDARDKGSSLSFGKMRPFDPSKDREAFCIHYCTTPEYSTGDAYFSDGDIERDDPALIQTIEELGAKANGSCADLAVEDVPAGVQYRIDEYDGNERVMTRDSYDWKVA